MICEFSPFFNHLRVGILWTTTPTVLGRGETPPSTASPPAAETTQVWLVVGGWGELEMDGLTCFLQVVLPLWCFGRMFTIFINFLSIHTCFEFRHFQGGVFFWKSKSVLGSSSKYRGDFVTFVWCGMIQWFVESV